jgi:transposase InsO family protein
VKTVVRLEGQSCFHGKKEIMDLCHFSRSQLYEWFRGVKDRKPRETPQLLQSTMEAAVETILKFPHLGGRRGQSYLIYHRLGSIGIKAYDKIKKQVGWELRNEAYRREDCVDKAKSDYKHRRPEKVGEIWGQDFTDFMVDGCKFYLAFVKDLYSQEILAWGVSTRATASWVTGIVRRALAANDGRPPRVYLINDNGKQYVSEELTSFLEDRHIEQQLIPAGTPQYNGSVEGSQREMKSIFFNIWVRPEHQRTRLGESLESRVQTAMAEAVATHNERIPKPSLGGVTPADVRANRAEAIREANRLFVYEQDQRPEEPWTKSRWEVIKDGIRAKAFSAKALMTKWAFFGRKPLRRIYAMNKQPNPEGVGEIPL